jgi:hypothetical protein
MTVVGDVGSKNAKAFETIYQASQGARAGVELGVERDRSTPGHFIGRAVQAQSRVRDSDRGARQTVDEVRG